MAVDFDGTNDGMDVDISSWGTITGCWWTFHINYDAAAGLKPVLYMDDSGGSGSVFILRKNNTGTVWTCQASIGAVVGLTVTATLSTSTWWCVQVYVYRSGTTLNIGIRAVTDGVPISYTTNSATHADVAGWGLDTCKFGYGNGSFFNGRLAEVCGAFALPVDVASFGLSDGLMRGYTPPAYRAEAYDYFGSLDYTHYWPLRSVDRLTDEFTNTALSLVDAPVSDSSHPRIFYPRRGRRVIHLAPAVTTRRVSLGGFYKTTGNRVVLVG